MARIVEIAESIPKESKRSKRSKRSKKMVAIESPFLKPEKIPLRMLMEHCSTLFVYDLTLDCLIPLRVKLIGNWAKAMLSAKSWFDILPTCDLGAWWKHICDYIVTKYTVTNS